MNIPVSKPDISHLEREYALRAIENGFISGVAGEFLNRFDSEFAKFLGCKYSANCSNGTTAIHLALKALDIKKGDEVLVSTTTNMATFFAVIYCGAKPIPIDIDSITFNMCPYDLERKITKKSKAILVVHLFGHPAPMKKISEIAKKFDLKIIEDCAEVHGGEILNKKAGTFGDISAWSFFGNKILSTGEGGAVTTNNPDLYEKVLSLKSLSYGKGSNRFFHTDIGFNYRMTNVTAAIGVAQIERSKELISKRINVCRFYSENLKDFQDVFQLPVELEGYRNVYWMYHLNLTSGCLEDRLNVMNYLEESGVQTRPGFVPGHLQPVFKKSGIYNELDCPNASKIAYTTLYLPTFTTISNTEQLYVIEKLLEAKQRFLI